MISNASPRKKASEYTIFS